LANGSGSGRSTVVSKSTRSCAAAGRPSAPENSVAEVMMKWRRVSMADVSRGLLCLVGLPATSAFAGRASRPEGQTTDQIGVNSPSISE
jgi:hypothetical protein